MIFSPLPGSPLITQGFGQNPSDYAVFGMAGHNGIDFGIPEGTAVYAPHDGTITVKDEGSQGYGISVTIDDGKRRSLLAHLSSATAVSGKTISQGDPIGLSGKTGNCTGPHLHWTFKLLKNGQVQNADNGYQGAMDASECTRLWQEQSLHDDAQYADTAQDYLAMTFPGNQYIKRSIA
ncbi:M23 family metallopeptidase [Candidatus Peribacteria bacterium]|nr:M23 family metallopeptidase [Candidatus Peribacteria bacterium]